VTRNLHSVELQNRAMSRASTRLRFIEPQLPTLVDQPPEGADWIHEIKHDGYRTMLVLERGKACAYTRNGHDWSDRYSGIIRAAVKHPCRAATLDGLRDHLLVERRAKLQTLLRSDPESPIQFSEEFIGDASAFSGACATHELERIVSKLATSRYRSGRSKTWLKTKCFTESEFFLLGIDRDRKTGAPRALLAKSERGQFIYAGPAFIALRSAAREEFRARLAELKQERPVLSWLRNRDAHWVRPQLTLKVKHLAGARLLRHATVREMKR
jgi:bifunctional non-homologous end joining protein LigD